MQEQIKQNEILISQKNDIVLQVQSIERKADGIQQEKEALIAIKQIEQEKRKANIEKVVTQADLDMAQTKDKHSVLGKELKELENQLTTEEAQMKKEISEL